MLIIFLGFTTLLTESKYSISVWRYVLSNGMVYFSPHALFSQAGSQMLWVAFTTAFYGFLKVGELTNLRWNDISFSPDHISINLQQSKTDPFRWGCKIKIFSTKTSTCPYHAMKCYCRLTDNVVVSNHIFQSGRFHPLSRSAVTNTLHDLFITAELDYSLYASHSFRIGAATTVAVAGLLAWLIKN